MKRFTAICALSVYVLFGIFPQQLWTGTAVGGGTSDFPEGGLVAASNSFPIGTMVDVTNPSSGETLRLEVVSRVRESGVFLLLSEEAAQQLGVGGRYPSIVQAEPAPIIAADRPAQPSNGSGDTPFSTDPDLNPAASLGDPNAFLYDNSPIPELDFPSGEGLPPLVYDPLDLPLDSGEILAVDPEAPRQETGESTEVTEPAITEAVAEPGEEAPESLAQAGGDAPEETLSRDSGPAQGISSALKAFADPERGSTSLLAQGLEAAQQEAESRGADLARENDLTPAQTTGPEISPRGPQDIPEQESAPSIASLPDPMVPDSLQESVPTEVVDSTRGQAEPEVLEPALKVSETDQEGRLAEERRESDSPYAQALPYDPAMEALESYRQDFDGTPLARSGIDGRIEVPEVLRPRTPEASIAEVPAREPDFEVPEAVRDDIQPLAGSGSSAPEAIAGYPEPDFAGSTALRDDIHPISGSSSLDEGLASSYPEPGIRLERAEVPVARLEPRITSMAQAELPPARFAGETYDDFLEPLEAPDGRLSHPSLSRLPRASDPIDLGPASPSLARSWPSGILAGIDRSVPEPSFDSSLASASLPRAEGESEGGDPYELPEASFDLERADSVVDRPMAPADPEHLITLVPAEFRPAGSTGAGDLGADPAFSGPRASETQAEANLAIASSDPLNPEGLGLVRPEGSSDPAMAAQAPELRDPDAFASTRADTSSPDLALRNPELGEPEAFTGTRAGDSDIDLALRDPDLTDPDSIAAAQPGSDRDPSVALSDPGITQAEALAAAQSDPGRDPGLGLADPALSGPDALAAVRAGEGRDPDLALRDPSLASPDALVSAEPLEQRDPGLEPGSPSLRTPDGSLAQPGTQAGTSDLMAFLEPAGPRTPADTGPASEPGTQPEAVIRPETPTARPASLAGVPMLENLDRDSFYVQLGAFANPDSARGAIGSINPGYPIAVQPVDSGARPLYRLYVGPLSEDEKGTALFWFRAKGFRDAFIRAGSESL